MRVAFVSNYINHHQLPFCEAMISRLGENFLFIQTQEMEEERKAMGWKDLSADLSFVCCQYKEPDRARKWILESDVLLAGWAPEAESLIEERVAEDRLTFRLSERIYREGQWKAVSPRGRIAKYRQFTRFRKQPYWLLCCGAYVGSDFDLVSAFPGKKLAWGYFPPVRTYQREELQKKKQHAVPEIVWAGRFAAVKHPELIFRLAEELKEEKEDFHLTVAGGGGEEEKWRAFIRENGLTEKVALTGFLAPEKVRDVMERGNIFVFTSDHGEGWGAVVNEAMNSGCAVIAGTEAGAVPYLIENGKTGLVYSGLDYEGMKAEVKCLLHDREKTWTLGEAAMKQILSVWNAQTAAQRLLLFCGAALSKGSIPLPSWEAGPMSRDPERKPFMKAETGKGDFHG